jgi:hypothetical protein
MRNFWRGVAVLLGLLGIPLDHPVDGTDLSTAVRWATQTGHQRVFTEIFYRKAQKSAVIDAEHLLIRDNRRRTDTLYARQDTAARSALSRPEVSARLGAILTAWEADRAASVTRPASSTELSDETRRQLEAMG